MALSVVVLAAGQGKRMHSALPKVLQPIAGRPMLAHVLAAARAIEPKAIHIVHGHGGEQVQTAFADAGLKWAHQADQLGTGHAVMQALPSIPDGQIVLVLLGDVPLVRPQTLKRLVAEAADGALALLTAVIEEPYGYGRVMRDEHGAVHRIVEEKDATDDERRVNEVNTGLLAMPAAALRRFLAALTNDNSQGEYYLTDVIGLASAAGMPVRGIVVDEPNEVLGINDRAQLAVAERTVQRQIALDLMARGVTLADPERFDVRGTVNVGRDVFIDVGVVLSGEVTLGDRVRLGPYTVVADTTLGEDTVVHAHSVLDGVTAGARCEIGPFARLRPQAELAAEVKIGNFVEVKKSRVGDGSKVNHLSYVGDSTVGARVNVGAGTITCNYDGANKHRTVIGDDAFIGSNSSLVAPVEIGTGATIGAGSTITKDAPAGVLTVARARQSSIDGWQRPTKKRK